MKFFQWFKNKLFGMRRYAPECMGEETTIESRLDAETVRKMKEMVKND